MTDLISRADAIEALRGLFDMRKSRAKVIVECFGQLLNALPSAEYSKPLQTTLNGDLVSRTDAIEAVAEEWLSEASAESPYVNDDDIGAYRTLAENLFKDVPSAETHEIRTETHGVCSDLISRQDVLCILEKMMIDRPLDSDRWVIRDIDKAIKSLPSADAVPQLKQTDTLIIADALRYLAKDTERHLADRTRADALRQQFLKYGASMCKGGDDE